MVGGDELAEAYFRNNGILRVETFEGLIELPQFVAGFGPPQGRGVGVMTATGGAAAMIVDRLGAYGDRVPEPPEGFRAQLAAEGIEISDSPLIDMPMGTGDGGRYARILTALQASDHCDAVIAVMGSSSRSDPEKISLRITQAELGKKPLAVFAAPVANEFLRILSDQGIAGFRTPESCADAVHAYLNWHAPAPAPQIAEADLAAAQQVAATTGQWDERSAGALFAALGVPVADHAVVPAGTPDMRVSLSGPLAVKCLSPDIAHKSDAGLVRLNIDAADVETVARDILDKARSAFPEARLDGVLVQRMERGLAEVILGYRNDREVGPVVVLGMGGVTAELRPSISVRLAPIGEAVAWEMIAELPELKRLDGYRNLPRGDLEALAAALVRFSRLALLGAELAEAEINPLLIREAGKGVAAVDALVVTGDSVRGEH
jgi:acyl-CoA synthetase (NDP forming)